VSPTELEAVLEHARERTEALLEPLDHEQLTRQVSPLQSPLRLRVEVSSKFRRTRFEAELERADFDVEAWWTDEVGDFAVVLARSGS
jgi:uncharacterized SAM-dependent methyltransferase